MWKCQVTCLNLHFSCQYLPKTFLYIMLVKALYCNNGKVFDFYNTTSLILRTFQRLFSIDSNNEENKENTKAGYTLCVMPANYAWKYQTLVNCAQSIEVNSLLCARSLFKAVTSRITKEKIRIRTFFWKCALHLLTGKERIANSVYVYSSLLMVRDASFYLRIMHNVQPP